LIALRPFASAYFINPSNSTMVRSRHELTQRLSLVAAVIRILSGEGTEVRSAEHGKKVVHRGDSMVVMRDPGRDPVDKAVGSRQACDIAQERH
jgi:hypothetical protein